MPVLMGRRAACGLQAMLLLCPLWGAATCEHTQDLKEAERMMRAGNFQTAADLLTGLETTAPACDPEQYHLLAIAWLNLKANIAARDAVERGLKVFPDSAPLQAYYVSVLNFAFSRQEAAARLETALSRSPRSPVYTKALAGVLLDIDPEGARAGVLLAAAIRQSPHDVESRCLYARWLCAHRREREALHYLHEALQDAPRQPDVQVDIFRLTAVAQDRLDQEEAAEAAYREAMEWNSRRAQPSGSPELEYAEFLMRRARDTEAGKVLRVVLARSPGLGPAHFDLARVLAHANQYDAAIAEAGSALASAPGIAEQKPIHIFLAKTLHAAGRDREALAHEEWAAAH